MNYVTNVHSQGTDCLIMAQLAHLVHKVIMILEQFYQGRKLLEGDTNLTRI